MVNEFHVNQYLTFRVDGEKYAVNVGCIREVLEFQSVSKVPRMPDYMRGIINLRGRVVPVIDLKMKFDLGATEKSIDTSVIVTELSIAGDEAVIGLLTDSVSEVIDINDEEIQSAPNIGTKIDASFIQGIGKKDDQFIVVLNINKVLSPKEMSELDSKDSL